MKAHTWTTEYVDGGSIDGYFWICSECEASGGPVMEWPIPHVRKSKWPPFYADGSGLKLTEDCDESKRLIMEHLRTRRAR